MRTFLLVILALAVPGRAQQTTWRFDSLTSIANNPTTLIGAPTLIQTDLGKAVHFSSPTGTTGDAIFLNINPLAGASAYTFEVIFRPSSAGLPEQRFFHLQESASQSRRMFELRIHDGKWCLDTVAFTYIPNEKTRSGVMLNCDADHLFPLDRWYAIAAIYDGKVLRAYVNGALQGEIAVDLLPLGPGRASVGTRIDQRNFFTGDIFLARFTNAALPIPELLKVPGPAN
jgi:hypothetical protein